jgi:hypothetical protein
MSKENCYYLGIAVGFVAMIISNLFAAMAGFGFGTLVAFAIIYAIVYGGRQLVQHYRSEE